MYACLQQPPEKACWKQRVSLGNDESRQDHNLMRRARRDCRPRQQQQQLSLAPRRRAQNGSIDVPHLYSGQQLQQQQQQQQRQRQKKKQQKQQCVYQQWQ